MTYVVAFCQPGRNTIFVDSHVSWCDGREGRNDDLKLGLLFRGCFYAALGNAFAAQEFVRSFKESIHGTTDTVAGFWGRFEQFVQRYPFPTKPLGFELLLSHRARGAPQLAQLDSQAGLEEWTSRSGYYLGGWGTGAEVLNDALSTEFGPRLKALQQYLLSDQKLPQTIVHEISPYFVALWLNERSLTSEAPQLERRGVGGVFHFAWQTAEREEPQHPAVYIFSRADRTRRCIFSWAYRVAAVQGGLYVEKHEPGEHGTVQKLAYFDSAARYDVQGYSTSDLRRLVEAELSGLPFYRFCGFGFVDPTDRRSFGFLYSSNGKQEHIFVEGRLAPDIAARIAENFEQDLHA